MYAHTTWPPPGATAATSASAASAASEGRWSR